MPSPNGNGRTFPIISILLSGVIAGVMIPVGRCFYDELKSTQQNQAQFGSMLAAYGKRLEIAEDNSKHVFDLRIDIERLRSDVRRLGDAAGLNISSVDDETTPKKGG